jgi:light-regulated signal transduction histidine kinase (bacteriophytochrome)
LRSPLRAINGFTQVLVEDYAELFDEEGKSVIEEIIANSDKMGELIDNLLEFAHIGKQSISLKLINISEMLESIINEQIQHQPTRKINITLNPLENIKGDKGLLRQVFINLVSNAFKYTGKIKDAAVEIGSYRDDTHHTFYVKDNGVGFDMLYYDKLFGVFQRLHSSNEFEGTGVGLAIIQRIVNKHGGRVWAEAKVNEGACFYVSFPVSN